MSENENSGASHRDAQLRRADEAKDLQDGVSAALDEGDQERAEKLAKESKKISDEAASETLEKLHRDKNEAMDKQFRSEEE